MFKKKNWKLFDDFQIRIFHAIFKIWSKDGALCWIFFEKNHSILSTLDGVSVQNRKFLLYSLCVTKFHFPNLIFHFTLTRRRHYDRSTIIKGHCSIHTNQFEWGNKAITTTTTTTTTTKIESKRSRKFLWC